MKIRKFKHQKFEFCVVAQFILDSEDKHHFRLQWYEGSERYRKGVHGVYLILLNSTPMYVGDFTGLCCKARIDKYRTGWTESADNPTNKRMHFHIQTALSEKNVVEAAVHFPPEEQLNGKTYVNTQHVERTIQVRRVPAWNREIEMEEVRSKNVRYLEYGRHSPTK